MVRIDETGENRKIVVEPQDGVFAPTKEWQTRYPFDLIESILRIKGPGYLCDEIMRDENPNVIEHQFHWDILSYVSEEELTGRRILDFGSGCGASAMVLARMFPGTEIVGITFRATYDNRRQRNFSNGDFGP